MIFAATYYLAAKVKDHNQMWGKNMLTFNKISYSINQLKNDIVHKSEIGQSQKWKDYIQRACIPSYFVSQYKLWL